MPSIHRISSRLLGALCLVAVAVAQGADAPVPSPVVVPEPPVAPAAEDATPFADETGPLAEYEVPSAAEPALAPLHGGGNGYLPEYADQQQHYAPAGGYSHVRRGPFRRFKGFMQRTHWGYAEYFLVPSAGSQVAAHRNVQIVNAMAAQMALYRYDFHDGIRGEAFELNEHGLQRLRKMASLLQRNVYPLVVEPTPEQPALAAARRNHVLNTLDKLGMPVPEEWVVVAKPPAFGLSGEEAIGVHEKMMSNEAATQGGQGNGMGSSDTQQTDTDKEQ